MKILILSLILITYMFGVIKGSKHDLSTSGTTEVCVFCHTPHGANSAFKGAPMWNRKITDENAFVMYSSPSFSGNIDSKPNNISKACLSCHDGVSGSGASAVSPEDTHSLMNAPGSGGVPDMSSDPACTNCHKTNSNEPSFIPRVWSIGPDLTDDHPVSVTYPTSNSAFKSPTSIDSGWSDIKLFEGKVECSSCHNPHDNSNGRFLRKSNIKSSLCLTCHKK